jgi:hypothetical protein
LTGISTLYVDVLPVCRAVSHSTPEMVQSCYSGRFEICRPCSRTLTKIKLCKFLTKNSAKNTKQHFPLPFGFSTKIIVNFLYLASVVYVYCAQSSVFYLIDIIISEKKENYVSHNFAVLSIFSYFHTSRRFYLLKIYIWKPRSN